MNLDDINLEIIRMLKKGVRSPKAIAKELDVSYNTVRRRIEKLEKGGLLKMRGLVDVNQIPGHTLAVVCLNFDTRDLDAKAAEVKKLDGVISVGLVTGRYDLVVLVTLNGENDLYNFNIRQMGQIKGVTFSETFVMFKNVDWMVPYVL